MAMVVGRNPTESYRISTTVYVTFLHKGMAAKPLVGVSISRRLTLTWDFSDLNIMEANSQGVCM